MVRILLIMLIISSILLTGCRSAYRGTYEIKTLNLQNRSSNEAKLIVKLYEFKNKIPIVQQGGIEINHQKYPIRKNTNEVLLELKKGCYNIKAYCYYCSSIKAHGIKLKEGDSVIVNFYLKDRKPIQLE